MMTDPVETILEDLGVNVVRINGREIQALCPGHKERTGKPDNNPSWYINSETGQHICFSCGFKGNLQFLVAFIKGFKSKWDLYDFDAARRWIERFDGLSLEVVVAKIKDNDHAYPLDIQPMSESRLALYVDPPQWARAERGLNTKACEFYGVRWDAEKELWITPVRDSHTGKLIGWQEKSQVERFFKFRPPGMKASWTMYGVDRFLGGTMIVVESPLDAVRLLSVGVSGAVASFGSSVSVRQLGLCRKADTLIVAMDNDDSGKKAMDYFLRMSDMLPCNTRFFNYSAPFSDEKDVGAMSRDDIMRGINGAYHVVEGRKVILGS